MGDANSLLLFEPLLQMSSEPSNSSDLLQRIHWKVWGAASQQERGELSGRCLSRLSIYHGKDWTLKYLKPMLWKVVGENHSGAGERQREEVLLTFGIDKFRTPQN